MPKAIEVRDLSKLYRIGEIGTGTVTQDFQRWWQMNVLGKEDPYLTIGELNDREQKGQGDVVYSLQDINFDIEQGDAVAIIGKNGAGKSTLLKILSRVTSPTTGTVKIKGRVASLLEVGTGFHPELTGRENIYLNGGILGMRKKEITRKLDEIIDFSGVERYIDTPVKRYSSGMYVRLAFAVAAHLESEILIIDEVLAVGDAEFQKKCLGKMGEVSRGEGRTVLFVSHNLGAVSKLCSKGVLLKNGTIARVGEISEVLETYTLNSSSATLSYRAVMDDKDMYVERCQLKRQNGDYTNEFLSRDEMEVEIVLALKDYNSAALFSFTIQSNNGDYLSTFVYPVEKLYKGESKVVFSVKYACSILAASNYFLRLAIFVPNTNQVYDLQEMICPFRINDSGTDMAMFERINYGYFNLDYKIIRS